MNRHFIALALRWCLRFNQLIGISNAPFNRKTGRFDRRHLPAMVYCMTLNLVYLVAMPFAGRLLVRTYYICEPINISAVGFNVLIYGKQLSVVSIMWGIWFRRRRLLRVANQYAYILLRYADVFFTTARHRKRITQCARVCLIKWLLSSVHILLALLQLFSYGSGASCGRSQRVFMPPGYIASSIFMLHMQLVTVTVDCTLFIGQAIGNMLLNMLQQELSDCYADLRLLCSFATCCCRRKRRCHHALWLWQLQRAVALLNKRRRHLYALQMDFLGIYQWQLLVTIYHSLFTAVYLLFRILVFTRVFTSLTLDVNVLELLCYLIIFLLFYFEVMLRFYIFEQLQLIWLDFAILYADIWLEMQKLGDVGTCRGGVLLTRLLEFGLFEFGRQLTLVPQRVRRLQIVGLFDLNNASSFSMSSAIIMNVLILCQLAMQNMNKGTFRSDGSE